MTAPSILWARIIFGALIVFVTYQTLIANAEPGGGLAIARWISEVLLSGFVSHDKVAHFLAYAALGAVAFFAQANVFGKVWLTPLWLAVYGGLLEILQGIGGVRMAEFNDELANALGAAAGVGGAYAVAALLRLRAA